MEQLNLTRIYKTDVTLGTLNGKNIDLKTIELPNLNNIKRKSCIPEGTYQVLPRTSKKHSKHYHLQNVKNRNLILIHKANYTSQLLGCIAVGLSHRDINKDGKIDLTSSSIAMQILLYRYPKGFTLIITSK